MDVVVFLSVNTYVYFSLTSDVDPSFVESLIYSLRHIFVPSLGGLMLNRMLHLQWCEKFG